MLAIRKTLKLSTLLVLLWALLLVTALPIIAQDDMAEDETLWITVRRYEGFDPNDMDALAAAGEDFLHIINETEGFVGYYFLTTDGDVLATVSIFTTEEAALVSNEQAADFIAENIAPLLPDPPVITAGDITIGFVEMLDGMSEEMDEGDAPEPEMTEEPMADDMAMDEGPETLFMSLRIYNSFDPANAETLFSRVEEGFLPIMRESEGFFGYYTMETGGDVVAALSIFESEEAALASNEQAADYVAENFVDLLPNDPQITEGLLAIAALAGLNDGDNLLAHAEDAE